MERTQNNRTKKVVIEKCYFCENKSTPNYKDNLVLRRFITERGKIVPASRSGICSKHQRSLSKEIKKARFMALIPYTESHSI